MMMTNYRLPDGRIVPVDASAASGATTLDYTLTDGSLVQAVRADLQPLWLYTWVPGVSQHAGAIINNGQTFYGPINPWVRAAWLWRCAR